MTMVERNAPVMTLTRYDMIHRCCEYVLEILKKFSYRKYEQSVLIFHDINVSHLNSHLITMKRWLIQVIQILRIPVIFINY